MNRTFLRQILLSSKLFITADGYNSAMMDCFPLLFNADPVPGSLFIVKDPPTYKETCTKVLNVLKQELSAHSELQGINVTDDFHADDLPEGSIAYHRVWGFVTAASCWHFSTKQFEQDLLVAESNPGIACHFLHVNTPGGEAGILTGFPKLCVPLPSLYSFLLRMYVLLPAITLPVMAQLSML